MQNRLKERFSKYFDYQIILEKPKDKKLGHFATPLAFSLAKELKKSPKLIAEDIASKLSDDDMFESVDAINGFINFKFSLNFLNEYANAILSNKENFAKGSNKNYSILLEYVSANPTGPLHIGHARGAIFGNALSKIGNYLGYRIDTEYYVNDAGNQMTMLADSIYIIARENLQLDVNYPEQFYRGDYIKDLADDAISEFGKDIFYKDLDEDLKNKLSFYGKNKMLRLIKENLKLANIEFDNFVSEKKLYSEWDEIFNQLKTLKATYIKDEKIWLKSSEFKDEKDRVIVRENGIPTYLAGDIIYHNDKFRRGYDKYINIWGSDHHGYIARVKASIELLGYDSEKLEIILSQMVALLENGEPYKMSKRAGNFILMSDIIDEIGDNALKFIFLTKKSDTHLEFDLTDLKKKDSSNPVFYINYAYSRVNSMVEKSKYSVKEIEETDIKNISKNLQDILFHSMILQSILEDAFTTRQLQKITEYLKQLASMIHSFYTENKILDNQNEKEILKTLLITANSIKIGLTLLGISIQEKM